MTRLDSTLADGLHAGQEILIICPPAVKWQWLAIYVH